MRQSFSIYDRGARVIPRPQPLYKINATDWRAVTFVLLRDRSPATWRGYEHILAANLIFNHSGAYSNLCRPWRDRSDAASFILPFVREWLNGSDA